VICAENLTRERGDIEDAMAILGIRKKRTVAAMAARGEIPSAAKIGRRWPSTSRRYEPL
jgi:hypothetical protein